MPARALKMLMTQSAVGAFAGRVPGMRAAYKNGLWRRPHFVNSFYGVYASYAEASAQCLSGRVLGWDTDAVHAHEMDQPSVFASLYWLSRLLQPHATLVDFGGATGAMCRAYLSRQPLPDDARWIVIDLPAVIARSQKLHEDDGLKQLSFDTDYVALPAVDIFFSAGSIQYLDMNARQLAAFIGPKPRHVVLNKFALTSGPGFWTLQHLGGAMAPNQIFNEAEFLSAFADAGYGLCDRWDVAELNCQIPFEPDRHVKAFTGLCFERTW
jgi:putative methyltransferase (TIGR04325 family)